MGYIKELEELCEKVMDKISEANQKLKKSGGELSGGDVEYLDKLTHMLKSIKTTIAMGEYDDEYSNAGRNSYARGGGSRSGGNSYEGGGNSYARGGMGRGRGSNARRDSMGRYSRDNGYSYDDEKEEMVQGLRELMQDAPDEQTKQEFKRFINKIENM